MDLASQLASDLTVFAKYARYIPELKRRETWEEVVARYEAMMVKKYPGHEEMISWACSFIHKKEVLPSMRALQFAGTPIARANSRIFNCAFLSASKESFFKETMFLLLGGTGVGYSVQKHHTDLLPAIQAPKKPRKWLVGDSIEGWADAVHGLMRAFFRGKSLPAFDFSDVRHKGARLVTAGGKAPGPGPLRVCLDKILALLEAKEVGSKLEPWEVSDIACYIADAVLSGGIRRSAMIALFDIDDHRMANYKAGAWWELNAPRGRVNISAVADRKTTTKEQFDALWKATKDSGAGEPGVFWTNDKEWGTNPCVEIGLRDNQMCNLSTINFSTVKDQADFELRVEAAAILGTLQAGFTDFHYLNSKWQETCEEDALLGVSITGLADNPKLLANFKKAAELAKAANEKAAATLGIKPAARITCTKPEGTASLVLGTASGVHARHAEFYIRRFRFKSNEAIVQHLLVHNPEIVVQDERDPDCLIVELPQKAPEGSVLRIEPPIALLERVKELHSDWIKPGHVRGENTHNVSCTVSIKDDEWDGVGLWMWMNRDAYTGLSVLPFSNHSYVQAPFEDCTEDEFNRRMDLVKGIRFEDIVEEDDDTVRADTVACSGGACEI